MYERSIIKSPQLKETKVKEIMKISSHKFVAAIALMSGLTVSSNAFVFISLPLAVLSFSMTVILKAYKPRLQVFLESLVRPPMPILTIMMAFFSAVRLVMSSTKDF